MGVAFSGHDDALRSVESLIRAFIFEFDVCYGIAFEVPRLRSGRVPRTPAVRRSMDRPSPALPGRSYAIEPVSLYSFARSVPNMPLQQFLAYYQAVEYFFPSYWESEIIRRLRRELSHPEFRVNNDAKVNRLVQIAKAAIGGRAGGSEKNQLVAVVDKCVEEIEIREFIEADEVRKSALTKRGMLIGIDPISLNEKGSAFIKQVCERIYAIRCRIVHAKEETSENVPAPLLPFTDEANRIGHDLDLMHFIAQRCIIASSSDDTWWK
jgi:hypothetical protein